MKHIPQECKKMYHISSRLPYMLRQTFAALLGILSVRKQGMRSCSLIEILEHSSFVSSINYGRKQRRRRYVMRPLDHAPRLWFNIYCTTMWRQLRKIGKSMENQFNDSFHIGGRERRMVGLNAWILFCSSNNFEKPTVRPICVIAGHRSLASGL